MDFQGFFQLLIQIAIFAIFVSTLVETVKSISVIGFTGLAKDIWYSLIASDKEMKSDSFPALNFAIALLCCWAFNVTIMTRIFNYNLDTAGLSVYQKFFARWLDYFGTTSIVYAGADQFFKRVLATKKTLETLLKEQTTV